MSANMNTAQAQGTIANFDSLEGDVDLNVVPAAFKKGTKSLGATARDHVAMPLDQIRFRENYNVRVFNAKYEARIEHIAESMLANGYQQDKPITGLVVEEDGQAVAYVVAGHTRVLAARLANERGANIEFIPMISVPKGTNDIDLLFDLQISNDTAQLSLYEQGVVNYRIINRGLDVATIARRLGCSEAHVRNTLDMRSAPRVIIEMIGEGRIAETFALEMLRKHGSKAIDILIEGSEVAQAQGKTKVTRSMVTAPKMPAPLGTDAISVVESFVQALDVDVLQSAQALVQEDGAAPSDDGATVSVPVSLLRNLIAMNEEIGKVREKMAQKQERAKARQQQGQDGSTVEGQGDAASGEQGETGMEPEPALHDDDDFAPELTAVTPNKAPVVSNGWDAPAMG